MKKNAEAWEDELIIDSRPLSDEDKKAIVDYIKNYRLKKAKQSSARQQTKRSTTKVSSHILE